MVPETPRQISDYLVNFAKEHGFKYVQDELNNVIIYKPATAGYEKRSDRHPSGTYGYGL